MLLLLVGLSAPPANSDDFNDARNAVRRDIITIRNDEARYKALQHKKNDQLRHGDFTHARGTQERIDYARLDLKRDTALLTTDRHALARLRR